ncbi:MAG: VCBS repeat-containing protein [Candidatus Bathyarchaeota archaeon]|nr:VCBS repeat-containing protein [Candidatus Bathyarchaeota archaeon]
MLTLARDSTISRPVWKYLLFPFLVLLLFIAFYGSVFGEQQKLVLLGEQHWDTYGVGGTCNHGTNNLVIADVDGDGVNEIVVGGFTYGVINGSVTRMQASLTIWSWDGKNFTLEQSYKWPGTIEVVFAADIDNDGLKEILTAGFFTNETGTCGSLRVWHWDSENLSLQANCDGIFVSSIFVSDLGKKGTPEILATGSLNSDSQHTVRLFLLHFDGENLILDKDLKLDVANVTSSNSVYASDLNNDGQVEILTAGYSGDLNDSKGQLCVWNWNGAVLSLKDHSEWQMVSGCYAPNIAGGVLGNTFVNNLKVADLNGNGFHEIITGGFTYDGKKVNGQLRVWSWDGSTLNLKSSREWIDDDITEVMCVAAGDVDSDSRTEIVTGGMLAPYGSFNTNATNPNRGQLCVWNWDGEALTLKEYQNWVFAQGVSVWNVGVSDLDNDGKMEIVSSGCISINNMCDPDMRLWSFSENHTTDVYMLLPLIAAGVVILVIAFVVIFIVLKRRR